MNLPPRLPPRDLSVRPSWLLIGPVRYEVAWTRPDDAIGLTEPDEARIKVSPDLDEDVERVVVLHEVIHAILSQTELPAALGDDLEEKVAHVLGFALLDFLRRNKMDYFLYGG